MTIQNATTYDISALEYLTGRYLPESSCIITVKDDDNLLDRFSTADVRLEAFLDRNKLVPIYTLSVRSSQGNIDKILCHEFCHLRQMEEGKLTVDMENRIFIWGKARYSAAFPYNSRPWELEAFRDEQLYLDEWKGASAACSPEKKGCLFRIFTHKTH